MAARDRCVSGSDVDVGDQLLDDDCELFLSQSALDASDTWVENGQQQFTRIPSATGTPALAGCQCQAATNGCGTGRTVTLGTEALVAPGQPGRLATITLPGFDMNASDFDAECCADLGITLTTVTTTTTTTTECPTTCAPPFEFKVTGVCGSEIHWFEGVDNIEACYEATLAEPSCAQDFFSFADRGNKNCGCKASSEHLSFVAEDDSYDCYHIRAPYELIGNGVAGESIYWFECGLLTEGVNSCYNAVMADDQCSKDYFVYNTRSDQGCGCKVSVESPPAIAGSVFTDYFKVQAPCDLELKTCATYWASIDCDANPNTECRCPALGAPQNESSYVTLCREDEDIASRVLSKDEDAIDLCCYCPSSLPQSDLLQTNSAASENCLAWSDDLISLFDVKVLTTLGMPKSGDKVPPATLALLPELIKEHPTVSDMTAWGYLKACSAQA